MIKSYYMSYCYGSEPMNFRASLDHRDAPRYDEKGFYLVWMIETQDTRGERLAIVAGTARADALRLG